MKSHGGRRPGTPTTREDIIKAARAAFAQRGYDAATLREIAQAAGVDPSLIHHYFGTKERLFLEVTEFPVDPGRYISGVFAGPKEQVAERLLNKLFDLWDSPQGGAVIALIRTAVQHDWSARLMREVLFTRMLLPLVGRLEPDAKLARWRTSLTASQIAGLAITRYVLKLEPLATAPRADIIKTLAPTIQRYLTGDVPPTS